MARRRPVNWNLVAVIFAVVLALGIYAGLVPFLNEYVFKNSQTGWSSTTSNPRSHYSFYEQFIRRFAAFITSGWFFIFGACIGSFINVVVWRMPLGKSALFKPSFCPRCHAKIRLIDNIPVLGWIKLRGRCRKCRLPISSRYPLVEFIFGSVFLLLFLAEFLTGAANIPGGQEYKNTGVVYLVWSMEPQLMGMYLFHCGLITFLLAMGLMRFDGSPIPRRLTLFVIAAGLAAAIAFPNLQTVRFWGVTELTPDGLLTIPDWGDRILTPIIGLLIGGLIGCWIGFVVSGLMVTDAVQRKRTWEALLVAGCATGGFLGWQAALSVFAIHGVLLLLALPAVSFLNRRIRSTRFIGEQLAVAVLIHLLIWAKLESLSWWSSGSPSLLAFSIGVLAATVGFVAFANVCRDVGPAVHDNEIDNESEPDPQFENEVN